VKTEKPRAPLIVAHRGSSGSAPENTLAAFRMAVDEGADMIELDVRLTKDFHLVVHHDKQLKRTTNGSGFLWDKTLQELRMLDAGSWFSPRFRGETIPTLRQVLEILPSHVKVNIEAKTDGDPRKRMHMEESCILIVLEKRFEERVLVSSFDHRFLRRMHDLYPAIKTGALYVPVRDVAKKPSTLARRVGVSAFITSHTQLRKRQVEDAHAHNIMVGCYSVNTRPQLEKVLKLGVDAVVTDYPGSVRRMIGRT
jgi:glycerophosphoryl diester phosphodiesterase